MNEPIKLASAAIALPKGFDFGEVLSAPTAILPASPPSLGPLAAFVGDWSGSGFNTIFRPDSPKTPTVLPIPVVGSDNIRTEPDLGKPVLFTKSWFRSQPRDGAG